MPQNLHLLRLFTAVVDHEGVVAAARALHLSQPAISRAVRELERQLGLTLLERTSRTVRLTPDGAAVYSRAKAVFAAERHVDETIQELKGLRQGTLHIGASTTIATYVLPPMIAEFALQHPRVELRLSAVHTRVIVDAVRAYELDVAFAEAPVTDPAIDVIPWRVDEMVLIAGPTHRLAHQRAIPAEEVSAEMFLLREPESGTRGIVLRGLEDAEIDVRRSMSIDGTEVIKQIVAEGFGVAVVSRAAVVEQLRTGRLVVLDVPSFRLQRPFNRLSLHDRRLGTVAQAFLAMMG